MIANLPIKNFPDNKFTRRAPRFEVQLSLSHEDIGLKNSAHIKNLSLRGAYIETVPVRRGTMVKVEFAFPGQRDPYEIMARVAWDDKGHLNGKNIKQKPGMGLHFLHFHKRCEEDLFQDLKYWGEPKPTKRVKNIKPLPSDTPGCMAMLPGTEIVMYLSSIKEEEIDQAIDNAIDPLMTLPE